MLVIATSVPDTREWIQWKGRTARQDKNGQYIVVLSQTDPAFSGYSTQQFKEFEGLRNGDGIGEKIDRLLKEKDTYICALLDKFKSDQAKGAWLNELCEKYYQGSEGSRSHHGSRDNNWPSSKYKVSDKQLRDALSASYENGIAIRQEAKGTFGIELRGPPKEWDFGESQPFPDFGKGRPALCVYFVIDVSFSMDEVEGADTRLSAEDKRDQVRLQG